MAWGPRRKLSQGNHLRPPTITHIFNRRCVALLCPFLFANSNSPLKSLSDHRNRKPSGYQSHASISHKEKVICTRAVGKEIHNQEAGALVQVLHFSHLDDLDLDFSI